MSWLQRLFEQENTPQLLNVPSRRSAARAARLDGGFADGDFGSAGFCPVSEAAFSPRRRLAGLDRFPSAGLVREPDMRRL